MIAYLALITVTILLGVGSQAYVSQQLKHHSLHESGYGLTGEQMAHKMLQDNGIPDVPVKEGSTGQNFFDPRSNSITLESSVFDGKSITAIATACHEVGHACQYAQGYSAMKFRSALFPISNFADNVWLWLFLIGALLNISGLVTLAIIMYMFAILFQVVTLPVEFNASNRALVYLRNIGMPPYEQGGVEKVLRACAFTYIAATLISVIQLVYYIMMRTE